MNNKVKNTERGWASHFCCAKDCQFHRSTLIEYHGIEIVVSTVGAWHPSYSPHEPATIGANRYYETMVGYVDDTEFKDLDASKSPLDFDFPESPIPWDEINANNIHDQMVEKWKRQIKTLNH